MDESEKQENWWSTDPSSIGFMKHLNPRLPWVIKNLKKIVEHKPEVEEDAVESEMIEETVSLDFREHGFSLGKH